MSQFDSGTAESRAFVVPPPSQGAASWIIDTDTIGLIVTVVVAVAAVAGILAMIAAVSDKVNKLGSGID